MSKPIIDLGPEVSFLNSHAKSWHLALQAAHNDLWLVFCLDLWPEHVCMTEPAFRAFQALINGSKYYTGVPIDAATAAGLVNTVLDSEDIAAIRAQFGAQK